MNDTRDDQLSKKRLRPLLRSIDHFKTTKLSLQTIDVEANRKQEAWWEKNQSLVKRQKTARLEKKKEQDRKGKQRLQDQSASEKVTAASPKEVVSKECSKGRFLDKDSAKSDIATQSAISENATTTLQEGLESPQISVPEVENLYYEELDFDGQKQNYQGIVIENAPKSQYPYLVNIFGLFGTISSAYWGLFGTQENLYQNKFVFMVILLPFSVVRFVNFKNDNDSSMI
jgi:hypothetical protein